MEMTKTFDAYEVIGVITPGAVIALLLSTEWPELRALMSTEGLSLGDLGLFLVVAFVMGHLLQALGNLVDGAFWALSGLPTSWIRAPRQTLVSDRQRQALAIRVGAMEGGDCDIATIGRKEWRSITNRMYARVRTAGRSARIDGCNRTYGLSRGLAAAFLSAAAWYLYKEPGFGPHLTIAAILAVVALYRMWRVSIHYAQGLFLEFLDLPAATQDRPAANLDGASQ